MNKQTRCNNCVLDVSVQDILFNEYGKCNYCSYFEKEIKKYWFPNNEGKKILDKKIELIKHKYSNRRYHAIIGLSGGLDSSYLALALKEYDLRILAVHVDAGWNSEIAVNNIRTIVNHCNFDLYTYVADWDTMRRLQLVYLKSGVANQDVPQDHIFFSTLYKKAKKERIKIIFSGGNMATESIFPNHWHADAMDWINIKSIFKEFGEGDISKFKPVKFWDWHLLFFLRKFEQIRPLDYQDYKIKFSIRKLEEIGWKSYGRKHSESIFTKFFQNYYLPQRFGYDKRIAHYSSRVLSGDMTRAEAMIELSHPLYEDQELRQDIRFIAKKLEISEKELDLMITQVPKRSYTEFRNSDKRIKTLRSIKLKLQKSQTITNLIRKVFLTT